MSELVTDAMVGAVAKRLDPDAWEMTAGIYQDSHGRSYGNAESFIQSARQAAMSEARAILRLAAPLIAAKALGDAAEELRRLDDGRTGGYYEAGRDIIRRLDARADAIERGES